MKLCVSQVSAVFPRCPLSYPWTNPVQGHVAFLVFRATYTVSSKQHQHSSMQQMCRSDGCSIVMGVPSVVLYFRGVAQFQTSCLNSLPRFAFTKASRYPKCQSFGYQTSFRLWFWRPNNAYIAFFLPLYNP